MTSPDMGGALAKAPGRLSQAITRLFMRAATVAAINDVADRFRLVTLQDDSLARVAWTPGQKVQITMGSAFVARSYTPIDWDAQRGRGRILGYAHGDGPGSAWLLGLRVGDGCNLFGPRRSLDVAGLRGPLAVFGDETSIGLGYALAQADQTRSVACYFEVSDEVSTGQAVTALGIGRVRLFARRSDETQIARMEAELPGLAEAGASFVLTGKAGTVQRLRQALKRHQVAANRIAAKAYWAPGKTGLD
ncbi:siderophore-interacting protein [Mangrovicella endophytica]|uniref:siderophore-interacting protein n=1 Tax=Mangrovicella endophytica TaxID=2066697 RepID=UPI001FE06F7F|nr:siderophore-interacting protein [Mangrovicella endophytica]